MSMVGEIGDKFYAEVLFIPDETRLGYPAMRIFNMGFAVNPRNGESANATVTADQPYVIDEAVVPQDYIPPTLTIEKVELVYYVPDPRYSDQNPSTGPQYIQPAWRFYGHYSDGSEVEFLVQALKQEFLLPDLVPARSPG